MNKILILRATLYSTMSKREFLIPSLAEIKAANKICNKNEPSLFKASTKVSSNPPLSTAASSKSLSDDDDGSETAQHTVSRTPAIERVQPSTSKQTMSIETFNQDFDQNSPATASKGLSTTLKESTSNESQVDRFTGHGQDAESANLASSSASTSASIYRPHAIIVNIVQKKNPLMKHIRNVPWEVGNIIPDFELGKTTCALFLSVRYHSLHPNYIHDRLKSLGKQYQLRVLLVLVDTSESQKVLHGLAKMALLADLTLIVSWSYEEAARYLETYKTYENKPPDMIMERIDSDSSSRVIECLTTVKKVNKTDAATLMNTFKTMEKLVTSSKEELTLCPGLGPLKAQRLHDLFHEPFLKSATKKPS